MMKTKLNINNQIHVVEVAADTPLLWVLKDTLKFKGTKFGCGKAQCDACTVNINGQAQRSCVTPVSYVVGKQIHTINDRANDEDIYTYLVKHK